MSEWWVTTELSEFDGFQRDWYGPFQNEADAEKACGLLSKQAREMVAETVFGVAGKDGTRFAEFVRGRRYGTGDSGWFAVKPSIKIAIPLTASLRSG